MGALADRLAYLARRYGSDAAAWQHEIHAVAALEGSEPKAALEKFHELKRRFAEFRREQLLAELRRHPALVRDVPSADTRGYPLKEIEADIREAARAVAHARAIDAALREEADARASLTRRALAPSAPLAPARWDALAPLAAEAEARRRAAAHAARLDRELRDLERRASKLQHHTVDALAPEASAEEIEAQAAAIAEAEALEATHRAAIEPLKAPEVATYRNASKRALEQEAIALLQAGDEKGLRALQERADALRRECAGLASQAARSRRKGLAPPPRERRPGDTMDGYG